MLARPLAELRNQNEKLTQFSFALSVGRRYRRLHLCAFVIFVSAIVVVVVLVFVVVVVLLLACHIRSTTMK